MEFQIKKPFDAHIHFRGGDMMKAVVPHTARHCSRALVMPNIPAIETGAAAWEYWAKIHKASRPHAFSAVMGIKLTHRTTPDVIRDAAQYLVVKSAKLYPQGATSGSHDGIVDVKLLAPVFAAMQKAGMVLCIHGEAPDAFVMDREVVYLDNVHWIVKNFPGLKVVLEHITTRDAVDFVEAASVNVAATITAHHLVLTLDDVLGRGIKPHHFCYPVAKTPDDRGRLLDAVYYNQTGRFFYGSDSAPWLRGDKESACGCAGVFSAPVALAVLADVFTREAIGGYPTLTRVAQLERFTSTNAEAFYGLTPCAEKLTFRREDWVVPDEYDGVVPFRAGETLQWKVVEGES